MFMGFWPCLPVPVTGVDEAAASLVTVSQNTGVT